MIFEGLEESINHYVSLVRETKRVEAFIKESLKARLSNSKQEEILESLIFLIQNQKPLEMINHEERQNLLDTKEQIHGRI